MGPQLDGLGIDPALEGRRRVRLVDGSTVEVAPLFELAPLARFFESAAQVADALGRRNAKTLGDGSAQPLGQRRHFGVEHAQLFDAATERADLFEQGLASSGSL
ncbi:MAG: hypothetical protein AAB284_01060, partial [Chloroflexota bacterium]